MFSTAEKQRDSWVGDLATKVGAALAVQFKLSSCADVREVGAKFIAPQQSVAVGQTFRRPLSKPSAAVRCCVVVARRRLHR